VQAFLTDLMLEVVRSYDVDGVQGGDRLPALPAHGGYDAVTAELWQRERRRDPPAPDDARWLAWRADRLTAYLASLASAVRAAGKGVVFSSSPSPYDRGLRERLQDSAVWVERGLVDLIHPQCYRRDLEGYKQLVDQQIAAFQARREVLHAPGVLIQSGTWRAKPADLLAMLAYNRQQQLDGEVLSSYEGLRANGGELARALLAGPYEERARLPHRTTTWRPRAIEAELEPAGLAGLWQAAGGGAQRTFGAGEARATWRMSSPVTGWYQAYVEVLEGGERGERIERTFEAPLSGVENASISLRPGLLPLGAVQVPAGERKLTLTLALPKGLSLTLGRAVLVLDRKLSPDVVWKD
jgi:hypothetical protein